MAMDEGCGMLVPFIAVSYVKQLHSWPDAAGGSVLVQGYKLTHPSPI
jgi:hypothetical protein